MSHVHQMLPEPLQLKLLSIQNMVYFDSLHLKIIHRVNVTMF